MAQTPEQSQVLKAQQVQLEQLQQEAKAQEETLSILNKKLDVLNNRDSYEAFMAKKREAIKTVQAAQFIVVERIKGRDPRTGKEFKSFGTSAGWVAKDTNGKLALLGCNHGVEEAAKDNPNVEYEIILGDLTFKTRLASNLPNGLSPRSNYLDIAYLAVPEDPALQEKLRAVALPLPNIMTMDLPAGSEALSIGAPLDTKRFVNEGIITYYDPDGRHINGSQTAMYPRLMTDSGTNPGNSGGPLIAYNWRQNEWQVVGATNSKQSDTKKDPSTGKEVPVQGKYQGAMCTPMNAFLAFLGERGFATVDPKDPQAVQIAAEILDHDKGFVLKQTKLLDFFMDEVLASRNQNPADFLRQKGLSRQAYLAQVQPRLANLVRNNSEFNKETFWDCLKVDDGLKKHYLNERLKGLVAQCLY
jgi:hypothetical protein